MKILIIGSEGFIGQNLCAYFLANTNYTVFFADIIDNTKANYVKINLDTEDFYFLFKNKKHDICINASGSGSVGFSNTSPLLDYKLNTLNVFLLLDAIRIHNPNCKFINFSSAAIYGNSLQLPVIEQQESKPVSPYGWHKLMSEIICKEFFIQHNIQTLSLRVFSVYGPKLQKQLFWDVYQKALISKTIYLEGTGEETRDFIYIDDLCQAVEKIILNCVFNADVINVASGQATSIKNAVTLFLNQLNTSFKICFNNRVRVGDPIHYLADVTKLKQIGFSTRFSIQQGLEQYTNWLKNK